MSELNSLKIPIINFVFAGYILQDIPLLFSVFQEGSDSSSLAHMVCMGAISILVY